MSVNRTDALNTSLARRSSKQTEQDLGHVTLENSVEGIVNPYSSDYHYASGGMYADSGHSLILVKSSPDVNTTMTVGAPQMLRRSSRLSEQPRINYATMGFEPTVTRNGFPQHGGPVLRSTVCDRDYPAEGETEVGRATLLLLLCILVIELHHLLKSREDFCCT